MQKMSKKTKEDNKRTLKYEQKTKFTKLIDNIVRMGRLILTVTVSICFEGTFAHHDTAQIN